MHCLTGLAHDSDSHVAYDPHINEDSIHMRSLRLASVQRLLKTPTVTGDSEGDLLVVGWGSTRGAIAEAVERVRADGHRVGAMHLQFLQPLAPGIDEILGRYDRVLAVENNWSDSVEDPVIDTGNRRFSNLAWLLRARFLVDVDCWGQVRGQPLQPGAIEAALRSRLAQGEEVRQ